MGLDRDGHAPKVRGIAEATELLGERSLVVDLRLVAVGIARAGDDVGRSQPCREVEVSTEALTPRFAREIRVASDGDRAEIVVAQQRENLLDARIRVVRGHMFRVARDRGQFDVAKARPT